MSRIRSIASWGLYGGGYEPPAPITGDLSLTQDVERFRHAVMTSAAFATMCGALDPADCVFAWNVRKAEWQNTTCLIIPGDGWGQLRAAMTASPYRCDSRMQLTFAKRVNRSSSDRTVLSAFAAEVDAVMNDLKGYDQLVNGWSPAADSPFRSEIEKADDLVVYAVNVDGVGL